MTLRSRLGLAAGAAILAAGAASAQPAPAPPAPPAAPQVLAPTLAPPPPPPAPTGEAASVISMLEKACIPLIKGQDPKAVATANGLRRSRDDLVLQLPGVQRITLAPPTMANPTVCTLTVNYDVDQSKPLVDALGNWGSIQTPPMAPLGSGFQSGPGMTGWSWSGDSAQTHTGLVLTVQKTPDGKPVGKGYDVATVLFSLTGS
jgi:hypothetical protein